MPAKMQLPAKAKMTAFVWSGRRRLQVRYGVLKFSCQKFSSAAM